jgi:hypothetical protein
MLVPLLFRALTVLEASLSDNWRLWKRRGGDSVFPLLSIIRDISPTYIYILIEFPFQVITSYLQGSATMIKMENVYISLVVIPEREETLWVTYSYMGG